MVSCSTNQRIKIKQPVTNSYKNGSKLTNIKANQPTSFLYKNLLGDFCWRNISQTINSRLSTLTFISPKKNRGSFLSKANPKQNREHEMFRGGNSLKPQPPASSAAWPCDPPEVGGFFFCCSQCGVFFFCLMKILIAPYIYIYIYHIHIIMYIYYKSCIYIIYIHISKTKTPPTPQL